MTEQEGLIRFLIGVTIIISLILGVAFIAYGIRTQCPDTAVYVYCPKEKR